jgi:hypothetical protein
MTTVLKEHGRLVEGADARDLQQGVVVAGR